jgi:hypothetical protein
MIIINNLITFCKYIINKTIGLTETNDIEFDYDNVNNNDIPICHCNLCYTIENIVLFATTRLIIKKHN